MVFLEAPHVVKVIYACSAVQNYALFLINGYHEAGGISAVFGKFSSGD
ncbi:MAG: hypothetical protein LRY50_03150 [Geovibrio sp.]|nr:hypothetical protein [Geovibrio sp.]